MQQTRLFDELPDDENIPERMYNDGGHNVWIVKTTNPHARKRNKYREREIEIAPTSLPELKELREKKNVLPNNEAVDDDYIAKIPANSPIIGLTEETPADTAFMQNTAQKTLKMTPRALFDILYESYADLKWKKKRNALIAAFLPYYKNYHLAVEFVDKNSRYLRAYHYVLKYLDKGGKLSNENKFALATKTEITTLNGEIITIDEEEPHKCLPNATTCKLYTKEIDCI